MSTRVPLPRWADAFLLPVLNTVLAFVIGGLVVALVGQNPLKAMEIMLYGAFGYGDGFGHTLYYATTFTFTGLAVALAFHAGLFNIGPEGQGYLGGLGIILVALALNGTHWSLLLPLIILSSAAFGAMWAFIPGYLQAKRGSHVVITTILFNFIATSLMSFIITRVLKPVGTLTDESAPIAAVSRIPQLRSFIPFFGHSPVNISLFVAIAALIGVYFLVFKTRLGYAFRTLGFSPSAARYAGMSNANLIMIAMAISGALAGMAALNEVGGANARLGLDFLNGAGFVGIAVAFMGRAHPFGVALAALLFGALYQGGQELAFSLPAVTRDVIVTIQALVILFTGAMGEMLRAPAERLWAGWSRSSER